MGTKDPRIDAYIATSPDSKKVVTGHVRQAMRLNVAGEKVNAPPNRNHAPLRVLADLSAALATHENAATAFATFSPSKQRDYIEWLTEAKTDATREKRPATAIEWIAEGKSRNWKYERS
jgi:uncharacterized protein YdeI (YjbR/CyaY-like superfamily)